MHCRSRYDWCLDARNDYETHLGTFAARVRSEYSHVQATRPLTSKKPRFDPKKNKKIATFCTGGIRCEKFSSWLLEQGFEEVYQLKGGILKYLEEIPATESQWNGECYVFDERVAIGHGLLSSKDATMCKACGHALTEMDRADSIQKYSEKIVHLSPIAPKSNRADHIFYNHFLIHISR